MNIANVKTERLNILLFSDRFINDQYVSWLNDPEVVRYSDQRHKKHSLLSCQKYFLEIQGRGDLFWAIFLNDQDQKHIGNIQANIDCRNQVADLSILIGEKKYWGNGYGLEAWNRIIKFLFSQVKVRKIAAGTMVENKGMLGIMKKADMIEEGHRRNHFLLDNKPVDVILMAKFKE